MKAGDFKAARIYKGILFKVSGRTNWLGFVDWAHSLR